MSYKAVPLFLLFSFLYLYGKIKAEICKGVVNSLKKVLSLIATATLAASISGTAHAKSGYNVNRIYGENRYKTSVNISNKYSSGEVENIIVTSGTDFPDALSGSVLSKKYNAPILLLNKTIGESSDSIDYIKNHLSKEGNIYVLGGTASIGEDFVNHMESLGYSKIIRLGGSNRADTNKSIVNNMNVEEGTPVIIANGYDGFADALSVSSVASSKGYPILITRKTNLPDEVKNTISTIKPSHIYIIGGNAAVSNEVINEVKSLIPDLDDNKIERISGETRYETSLSIAKSFNLDSDTAVIANGANFPDALSGSALAAKLNAPIILTNGQDIEVQRTFIDSKNFSNLILLGGLAAVDITIEYSLKGSNMTQSEKDFINNLSDYCETYLYENINTSKNTETLFNNADFMKSLENPSTPVELSNGIGKFIELLKDSSSYIETYDKTINTLKKNASVLPTPNGLESLKLDYLNNLDKEIESLDNLSAFIDKYVKAFSSFKDAVDSLDQDRVDQEIKQLDSLNINDLDSLQNLKGEEEKIKKLDEKLLKIKQSME